MNKQQLRMKPGIENEIEVQIEDHFKNSSHVEFLS